MASATAKWTPIARLDLPRPFSWILSVASSSSWWKSATCSRAFSSDPGPGVEVELQDRPIAVGEDGVPGRQAHELPCSRRRERLGRVDGVLDLSADKLRVRGVGDDDGQLGRRRGLAHEGEEARQRRDPAVEGFRGVVALVLHPVTPGQDLWHRGLQQPTGIVGPADGHEPDKAHDILAVGPLGVFVLGASDPGVKHPIDGQVEAADLFLDRRRRVSEQHGRAGRAGFQVCLEDLWASGALLECTKAPPEPISRGDFCRLAVFPFLARFLAITMHDNIFYQAWSRLEDQGVP